MTNIIKRTVELRQFFFVIIKSNMKQLHFFITFTFVKHSPTPDCTAVVYYLKLSSLF